MARAATADDWPEVERLLRAMGFADEQSSDALRSRPGSTISGSTKSCAAVGSAATSFEEVRNWAASRSAYWLEWHAGSVATGFYGALGIKPTPSEDKTHPFYELPLDA